LEQQAGTERADNPGEERGRRPRRRGRRSAVGERMIISEEPAGAPAPDPGGSKINLIV